MEQLLKVTLVSGVLPQSPRHIEPGCVLPSSHWGPHSCCVHIISTASCCLNTYRRATRVNLRGGGHLDSYPASQQDQMYVSAGTSDGKFWLERGGKTAYTFPFRQQQAVRIV